MTITLEMNPQGQPYNTLEELTNGGRCICHIIERRTGRQKHQQIVRSLNSTLNKRPKEKILCNNPQNSSKQFCIHNLWLHGLNQWSPTFFGTKDWFHERQFFHRWGWGRGWFQGDSSTLHLLCALFPLWLHQLHLGLSGVCLIVEVEGSWVKPTSLYKAFTDSYWGLGPQWPTFSRTPKKVLKTRSLLTPTSLHRPRRKADP